MWAALPLLAAPVALYDLYALLILPGGLRGDAGAALSRPLASLTLTSGASWTVTGGDLFVVAGLAILFGELLKSTNRRDVAIVNHSLSIVLFILCLVEFLVLRACATSAFFFLTSMVFLDVLAGFIVTIAATRREIGVGRR